MKCQHPIMSRSGKVCGLQAVFRIVLADALYTMNIIGYQVSCVCRQHAKSVASRDPNVKLVGMKL